MNSMYRFYNMAYDKFGENFTLCDAHALTQPIPANCVRHVIAEKSWYRCNICLEQGEPNVPDESN